MAMFRCRQLIENVGAKESVAGACKRWWGDPGYRVPTSQRQHGNEEEPLTYLAFFGHRYLTFLAVPKTVVDEHDASSWYLLVLRVDGRCILAVSSRSSIQNEARQKTRGGGTWRSTAKRNLEGVARGRTLQRGGKARGGASAKQGLVSRGASRGAGARWRRDEVVAGGYELKTRVGRGEAAGSGEVKQQDADEGKVRSLDEMARQVKGGGAPGRSGRDPATCGFREAR
ncbi:hypothetical protein TRIUR3_32258 [Triticum urartu]|uniref:Uncharacterized protein n=1 Tax=Triticum urartu TaxID=4572 RepID=M7Z8H4_TRIUA|nr:hypothetical protein TRIUR3_32258 [Triticum urartu]